MDRKKGLTLKEHEISGQLLKEAHEIIQTLSVKFSKSYPKKEKTIKHLEKASKTILEVRNWASERLFREHPNEANKSVYGRE